MNLKLIKLENSYDSQVWETSSFRFPYVWEHICQPTKNKWGLFTSHWKIFLVFYNFGWKYNNTVIKHSFPFKGLPRYFAPIKIFPLLLLVPDNCKPISWSETMISCKIFCNHYNCTSSLQEIFCKKVCSVLESLFNKFAGLRSANLLRRDSSSGIFLRILWTFSEHLFCRTFVNSCFFNWR